MAQRDTAGYKTVANSRFPDNTTGAIEEIDHRDQHTDTADSFLNKTDGGTVSALITATKFEANTTTDTGTPDAAFRVNRSLSSGATAGHGFRDQTIFTRSAQAYNAFDAAGDMGDGTAIAMDHWAGFQARNRVNGGTLTNWYGVFTQPNLAASTVVTAAHGYYVDDGTGTGTITTQYGLYVDNLIKGTTNYAVYTAGATQSYFGGNVGIGATPSVPLHILNSSEELLRLVSSSGGSGSVAGKSSLSFYHFNSGTNPAAKIEEEEEGISTYAGKLNFYTRGSNSDAAPTVKMSITGAGNVGIGLTPTAVLHLKAGTATANTAPLKLTTGTALTTPEDGALEYHSSHLYFTIGSTRYQLDQQATNLTSDTFSPTFTSETNLDSTPTATALTAKYTRVGDMVTVTMFANVDPTASGQYSFFATIPVASNFTAATDLLGLGSSGSADGHRCEVSADVANDRAKITGTSSGTTTASIYIMYTYKVM
jgi:hypothetical protein